MKLAYQALPGFCRHYFFKKEWAGFLDTLVYISMNILTTHLLIQPKKNVIEKQVKAKTHITSKYGGYIKLEEAYSEATHK
jgi:hypothetical protein